MNDILWTLFLTMIAIPTIAIAYCGLYFLVIDTWGGYQQRPASLTRILQAGQLMANEIGATPLSAAEARQLSGNSSLVVGRL